MKKKILVLGGSYFVGRVFMMLAARTGNYDLHVVNRGRYTLKLEGITQHRCNRHDAEKLGQALGNADWDAVIDFCAYEPGDIASAVAAIPGRIAQYVYISTCSVYEPSTPSPKTEASPLLTQGGSDPGLAYAYKKRMLEEEAARACTGKQSALTILRPTFIYGPFNYAPREPYYFTCILENTPIPAPTDATGRFQLVHVKDVAAMILGCIGTEAVYGKAYNLSAPERVTYDSFLDALSQAHGAALTTRPVSVAQVYAENIPLPFPLDADELYTGDTLAGLLGLGYIPFTDGLKESYDIYMRAHGAQT